MAGAEYKFGEGGSGAEMAVRTIEEQLGVLRAAASYELGISDARPENPNSSAHKAIGENLKSAADRIKTEIQQLKHNIDSIDMFPTGRS